MNSIEVYLKHSRCHIKNDFQDDKLVYSYDVNIVWSLAWIVWSCLNS